jgi:NAD(P)-dependent dehydrogenase (short-subunit alcohol dehydrogenase family)
MNTYVVTGASTGIGLATAKLLLAKGHRVYGSVRRAQDALTGEANFHPLLFDVTDDDAIFAAAERVRRDLNGQTLAGLVNNAGIAVAGPVLLLAPAEFRKQFAINVTGAFVVSQAFLPLLGCDPSLRGEPGRIVNISSLAGKIGWPMMGAYSGSKHALEGMSESMRRELALFGIKVSIVGPGAVKTPIWAKSEDLGPYAGTAYENPMNLLQESMSNLEAHGLEPSEVAEVIHEALTAKNPKARYAVVKSKLVNWWIPMWIPRKMFDNALVKSFGLSRAASARSGNPRP